MKTDTVVIIDDNQMAVHALVKTTDWEKLGCQVVGTASDGYEGLEIIREFRPDFVVTDIRMPGYSGLELIRLLTQQGYPGKFIIITGYEEFEYARRAIQYGVSDFLTKPVSAEDLEKSIEKIRFRAKKEHVFSREEEAEDSLQRQLLDIRNRKGSYSPAVRTALEYIDENLYSDLSLGVICDELSISTSWFSKLFKREVGIGFLTYLTMVKMNMAKRLLQDPQNKVYEVAEMLGYHDYTYFFQVFKKWFGHSPTETKMQKKI